MRSALPVQAIRLDSTFPRKRRRPQAHLNRVTRATGGWLVLQTALVITGLFTWLAILSAFVATVLLWRT